MDIRNILQTEVDPDWYCAYYLKHNIDARNAKSHFEQIGRSKGFYPSEAVLIIFQASSDVDRDWYRDTYKDVAASGIDPNLHYAAFGKAEGRYPNARTMEAALNPLLQLERDAAIFDEDFYRAKYPDVAATGMEPWLHYVEIGKSEGRFPNAKTLHEHINSEHRPFVGLLFKHFIGRQASNDELVSYTLKLMSGTSHFQILNEIANSAGAKAHRALLTGRFKASRA